MVLQEYNVLEVVLAQGALNRDRGRAQSRGPDSLHAVVPLEQEVHREKVVRVYTETREKGTILMENGEHSETIRKPQL